MNTYLVELLLVLFIIAMGVFSGRFCKRSYGFPFVYLGLAIVASFALLAFAGFYLWLSCVAWYFLGIAIAEGIYVFRHRYDADGQENENRNEN